MSEDDDAAFEAWCQAQPRRVQLRVIRLDAREAFRAGLENERAKHEPEDSPHAR